MIPQIKTMKVVSNKDLAKIEVAAELLKPCENGDMVKALSDSVSHIMEEAYKIVNEKVEHLCRTSVEPPIKGKITVGKTRWRGLKLIPTPNEYYCMTDFDFTSCDLPEYFTITLPYIGIEQRGRFIPFE